MSLKNVKTWLNKKQALLCAVYKHLRNFRVFQQGFLINKISIRTRLTIFYGAAAFSLLTIISLFLYWETLNIIHKADYQFLNDGVESVQSILKVKPINLNALKHEVIDTPTKTSDSIYRYFIRVLDDKHKVIMETPGTTIMLPADFQYPQTFPMRQTFRRYSNRNINYLLVQSPVELADHRHALVQMVLDISYQHTVMSDQKFLLISIILSALSSLILGYLIANRGMRSVYGLTDTVQQITDTSLHQRIDPKTLPKDLRLLGISFNQMLDRIEASFVRLKQFSSDLAHELRTPIHNLIGETELALSHSQTPEEYQNVLISNREEYSRISHMIENILFLSRAENPQLEIEKTELNVSKEIEVICDYYQASADDKQIIMQCKGNATLQANSVMFRRMISNLLSNAIKYTLPGGSIEFMITQHAHGVQIQLRDTGIGIAPDHLPKLFDRFYRVDDARTKETGGIGLGLPIVKSIVDLHHGSISIKSRQDEGTTIVLTFPK